MTISKMALSIGYIDDDLIESAIQQKRHIKPIIKWSVMAACLCLVFTFAFIPLLNAIPDNPSHGGASDGGGAEKINVSDSLVITGEEFAISDEQVYAHLQLTKGNIMQTLHVSGITVSDLTFTPKGYSPIHTGDNGNSLAVDWRTFLAFDGDKLVAIIEVTKDEKGLHTHLAFGGPGFGYYKQLLDTYKGQELVFLYIGDIVAFVTPDNTVVPSADLVLSAFIEPDYPYYQYFKTPYNTFVP